MKLRLLESRFLLLAVLASDPLPVHAAAPLTKVLITTGSASEREGALYVAQDHAEEGYQSTLGLYERKIFSSVDGVRNVIRLLGANNEKVRRLRAEELVDDSVVRKPEREGRF